MTDEQKPGSGKQHQGPQPEYRLVQVGELPNYHDDEDEIDLIELAKTVWEGRRYIYYAVGLFIVLGLFVALGSQEEYESEVRLMPESQQGSSLGGLGGLARQFGVGAAEQPTEGIPANLYPDITQSLVLMQRLMEYEVTLPETGEEVSLFDYFQEHQDPSAVGIAQKYTIKLPFTILGGVTGLFRSDEEPAPAAIDRELAGDEKLQRIIRMSEEEWEVVEALRGRLSASMDQETGRVSVSVKMPDPEIAADVAAQVVQFLTEYITGYRTEKARSDVEFIEERYNEARKRFEEAQKRLARFRDENRGQLTEMARTQEQRLQSEYDLTFNLYNTMAERLEEARIKLQEDTPVVNVLEPAAVPDQRSSPRRALIMVISVMLGGMTGVGVIFGKRMLRSARERW